MTQVIRISGKAKFVFKMIKLLAEKQGNIPINELRIIKDNS